MSDLFLILVLISIVGIFSPTLLSKFIKKVLKRRYYVLATIVFFVAFGVSSDKETAKSTSLPIATTPAKAIPAATIDPVKAKADADAKLKADAEKKAKEEADAKAKAEANAEDMSAMEPGKKLMVVTDVFDVIGKTEAEVIDWKGEPEETRKSEFRLSGTNIKVPAKTLVYSKFGDYEYFLVDGKVQRFTYTTNPNIVWGFEEKNLHDFMYNFGLKDAKLVEKNEKVAVYKHDKLYDIRVFNDGGNISYLYIIADEKYK
ncbi:hypothetical protein [Paenibacillus sp. P36]|uniref:hypothetical protein n=1 Tax=Paenibacillus sp. P36 TaxID=3342538 RepID=UPI0038B2D7A5